MAEKATILIVDDDQAICRTLSLIFEKGGYETETAGTGREAIEKAQGQFFNLALLDIKLPDMEGVELLTPLKEMHPDMVVIMVTAYASLETAVRALNEGASAYITKPLNMDEVLARVEDALEKQHLVMENRRLYKEAERELAERKRLEAEREKMQSQLLHSQKMEAVGRLAGGLAHDLNNVITAVISCSSFLLTGLAEDDPLRQDAEEINKAGRRAAGLIRQILAFARKQVLQPKVLDFNAAVIDMEEMLRRVISADIELVTVLEPELGLVKADVGQIEQVIMNLVVNARDAMPQGGALTISTKNVRLDGYGATDFRVVQPGSYVMLAVTDTGVGMDVETKSHIFEPFFTTKQKGTGTGLGLSTVHGIVKQSGGYVWVYSEPGQGTTFKIYLPRIDEKNEPAKLEKAQIQSFEGSETVLLVENDDIVRNSALRILQDQGYQVLKAKDGREAMRICEQHQGLIDLTVTDVVMPGMNGKELSDRLESLCPHMKILYMSGYVGNIVVDCGELALQTNFLDKPFSPEGLARKVREVLDAPQNRT